MSSSPTALSSLTVRPLFQSDWLFRKLREFCRIEYAIVDLNLSIVELSTKAAEFGNPSEAVQTGQFLCEGFPELIGCESILQELPNQDIQHFELKAATRLLANSQLIYFDFYIVSTQLEDLTHHLVVFFIDITQQMQLEQSLVQGANDATQRLQHLEASKSDVENILALMPCGLVIVTQSNKIRKLNLYSEKLFGYCESELLGKSIATILPDLRLDSLEHLKNVLLVAQTKTGEKISLSISLSIISGDQTFSRDYALVVQKLD